MDPIYVNAAEPLLQHQARTLRGPSNSLFSNLIGDQVTLSPEARRYAEGIAPVAESDTAEEIDQSLMDDEEEPINGFGDEALADDGSTLSSLEGEEAIAGIEAVTEDRSETSDESPGELTPQEEAEVVKLQTRDAEVRAHEAAHIAASGGMAGAASYTYATGPDGKRYAIGGEVSIRSAPTTDPEQALINAERMQAAALAPANPSGQDRAVAARAASMAARARVAIAEEEAAAKDAVKAEQGTTEQSDTEGEESTDVAAPRIEAARMGGPTLFGPAEHLHSDGCSYCSAAAARYRLGI